MLQAIISSKVPTFRGFILTIPLLYGLEYEYGDLPDWFRKYPLIVQRVALDFGPIDKLRGCMIATETQPTVTRDSIVIVTDDDKLRGLGWMETLVNISSRGGVVATYGTAGYRSYHSNDIAGHILGCQGYAMRLSDLGFSYEFAKFVSCVQAACRRTDDVAIAHYLTNIKGLKEVMRTLTLNAFMTIKCRQVRNMRWNGLNSVWQDGWGWGDVTLRSIKDARCDLMIALTYNVTPFTKTSRPLQKRALLPVGIT